MIKRENIYIRDPFVVPAYEEKNIIYLEQQILTVGIMKKLPVLIII